MAGPGSRTPRWTHRSAGFFPIIGVAGVSFVVALIGQLIAWGVLALRQTSPDGRRRRGRVLVAVASVVVLGLLGSALRLYQVEPAATAAGSVRVGIVQGNIPGRGIEAMGRARSVTNNHLSETIDLMTKVRLGQQPEPDFLLWPENSTDIDPTLDPLTQQTVQAAAEVAGRPILVGAVMQGPGADERQTAALWWDPDRGVLAHYDEAESCAIRRMDSLPRPAAAAHPAVAAGRSTVGARNPPRRSGRFRIRPAAQGRRRDLFRVGV